MTSMHHPAATRSPLRLYSKRIVLRPLVAPDFEQYREVRMRNEDWLLPWEPSRAGLVSDPVRDQSAFVARCLLRDKERQMGSAYGLGLFLDEQLIGEVNLNSVQQIGRAHV